MPPGTLSSSTRLSPESVSKQVGANDTRDLGLEGWVALPGEQGCGLAAVQPIGDPGGLFAFAAFPVEEVDGAVKLEQHAAERIQLAGDGRFERERIR